MEKSSTASTDFQRVAKEKRKNEVKTCFILGPHCSERRLEWRGEENYQLQGAVR